MGGSLAYPTWRLPLTAEFLAFSHKHGVGLSFLLLLSVWSSVSGTGPIVAPKPHLARWIMRSLDLHPGAVRFRPRDVARVLQGSETQLRIDPWRCREQDGDSLTGHGLPEDGARHSVRVEATMTENTQDISLIPIFMRSEPEESSFHYRRSPSHTVLPALRSHRWDFRDFRSLDGIAFPILSFISHWLGLPLLFLPPTSRHVRRQRKYFH